MIFNTCPQHVQFPAPKPFGFAGRFLFIHKFATELDTHKIPSTLVLGIFVHDKIHDVTKE